MKTLRTACPRAALAAFAVFVAAGGWAGSGDAPAAPPAAVAPTRAAALRALAAAEPQRRRAALGVLSELGTMADAQRLVSALRDEVPAVREAAEAALWAVWSRSGDAATDRRLAEGTRLMSSGALEPALAVFDAIVRARPSFAEGWNKRATVLFLLGRDPESLRDCDEVLKRNRHHFGALSGMAQIHLRGGNLEQALAAYERALELNPNLSDGPQVLRMLQDAVRSRREAAGAQRT